MIPMKWALWAIALLSVTARAQGIDLSRYPDAAASDPKAMGWMVGSPPPPDKTIRWRDGDHVLFPKLRWAVTHIRELQPTVNIARGTGSPATLSRAERRLDDVRYTDMNGVSRTKKQGENRLERGENFFGAATTAARDLGVKLAWELSYVPGTGHDSAAMSKAAANFVWGARK